MKRILPGILACLLTISLSAQNSSWFQDVSVQVGLGTTPEALRLNVVDLNNDDYPDIVSVETVNQREMINVFLNQQDTASTNPMDRMFVLWTDSSGINIHPDYPDSTRRSEIVSFADVDNDGDVDCVSGIWHWDPSTVNFPNDRATVMLNDGQGRFTHVPNNGFDALGLISIGGLSFFDYNLDGNIDVYVATFSDDHPNTQFRRDYIMVGNGDGTFFDRPSPFDIGTVVFPMYGSTSTDWDNDGWPDLMTSPYCRNGGSLWHNLGGGAFQDVAFSANYDAQQFQGDGGQDLCQWGAYPYDFDNDGDMDVFQALVHGGLDSAEGRSAISENLGPAQNYMLDMQLNRLQRNNPMSTHLGNMDAIWMDIDNDMLCDLIVTETEYQPGTDRGFFYMQDSTHMFEDVCFQLGLVQYRPHTAEGVDFDLDGDYDIIMNDRDQNTQIRVLRNDIGDDNHWVGVTLLAPPGVNGNSIGGRAHVYSGGVKQMRELQAGVGHWGGQQPFLMLFGLAQETSIDSIVVEWPSQTHGNTTVVNPSINMIHEIGINGLTSVASGTPEPELLLYPNPTNGDVTLAGLDFTSLETVVNVYTLMGARVAVSTDRLSNNRLRLRTNGLPAGVYIVEAVDQLARRKYTRKLVVQ